jgi:hypothetical protein
MSGTASVPNTFQSAVTATGLQLDQNYSTVVAYLNDPTNRNNYGADGGATNTVVVTFSPPVAGGYTAGLELAWKWAATNTGATVLNANGLGNINVVNPDGSALLAGQGVAGSIGKGVYDGTRAIFISPPSPATAAAVSAAATLAPYVSPGRMHHHPGVAKAWAVWNGTATGTFSADAAYNVSSIVRMGAGTYSVIISPSFATTAYAALASSGQFMTIINAKFATACLVFTKDAAGAAADAGTVNFAAFGAQ